MSKWEQEVRNWCEKIRNAIHLNAIRLSDEQQEYIQSRLDKTNRYLDLYEQSNDLECKEVILKEVEKLEGALHLIYENDRSTSSNDALLIGGHVLPPLPYPYQALDPIITEEMMRVHHLVHHQAYVDGLNKAEQELQNAMEKSDYSLLKHWQRELAFHSNGDFLHSLYWKNMTPTKGSVPSNDILKGIKETFGSYENFKGLFQATALKVEGSGWGIFGYCLKNKRFVVRQIEKHQYSSEIGVIPLLVIDVWEHAYYLKYKGNRKNFIENWWELIDWNEVNSRYNQYIAYTL